jgi:hypothetical protein
MLKLAIKRHHYQVHVLLSLLHCCFSVSYNVQSLTYALRLGAHAAVPALRPQYCPCGGH